MKLIIPKELQFIAERVLNSNLRPGTADNDIKRNAFNGYACLKVQWLTTS